MPHAAPLVSIMLPAKDADRTLREAAMSCLTQSLDDLELLLIENDSTPETIALMNELAAGDSRVRVIRAAAGAGFIAALNMGWQMAHGQFLARMDADDVSYPGRIEKQVKLLSEQPGLAACGTWVRIVRRGTDETPLAPMRGFAKYAQWLNSVTSPESIRAQRFIDSPISNPSAMMRREIFNQIGGYRMVRWAEDYDFWLRLLQADLKIGKVPEILVDWYDSESRLTRNDDHYTQRRFLQAKAHYLARMPPVSRNGVAICGAGPIGKRLARLLRSEGVTVHAFYDVSKRRIGTVIGGVPVRASDALVSGSKQIMVSAVGVAGGRERVRKLLRGRGYHEGTNFFCVT